MKFGFCTHCPKENAYPCHLYFFPPDSGHSDYFFYMLSVLKIFQFRQYVAFCELCNKEYFSERGEYTHMHKRDPQQYTGVLPCVLKDLALPFFTKLREQKYPQTRYISQRMSAW